MSWPEICSNEYGVTVDLDYHVVVFHAAGGVEVSTYALLKKDFPCASWVERLGRYRAWSKTQWVGDYDDYQIRDVIGQATEYAFEQGIEVSVTVPWYEEEEMVYEEEMAEADEPE
jgi:hypothetical protein